jgi:hypothetical protein
MTVLSTLPAPVIQMGHVEKIVEVAQNQPQVQQQVAQEAAVQTLREQQRRVAGVDTAKEGQRVREREAGGRGRQEAEADRHSPSGQETGGGDAESGDDPRKGNPWAGRIVNLKI